MAITELGNCLLSGQEKTAAVINWRTAGAMGLRGKRMSFLEWMLRKAANGGKYVTTKALAGAVVGGDKALRAAGNAGRWIARHPKSSLLGASVGAAAYQVPDKWRKYHLHTDPNNNVTYQGFSGIHYNQPGTEDYARKLPLLY